MVVAGTVAAILVGSFGDWRYAPLAGWDTAALIFAVWAWIPIASFDASRTAAHATREEPGRTATSLIVVVAAVANLGAVGVIVAQANSAKGTTRDLLAAFGVASVALSWFAVHTLFTLRYARLYFTGADGGVNFNQKAPPCYLDFAYLAFTIGMTFQVSDTALQKPAVRATALRHALLSYLFGAVILASTINLIAGLGNSGGG
ncbi:MAG: putative rane protein [Pseudonocardiales bacterium]|nr:putative rane protein [Pseudonocardiales bacterium]